MSRRLAILNAGLRGIVKPHLARTGTPEQAERDFDRAAALLRQPLHLREIRRRGAPPMTWFGAGPAAPGRAVLWFHGGGYVAGSARTHRGMLGRLARCAGVEVCAPDYRLVQQARRH